MYICIAFVYKNHYYLKTHSKLEAQCFYCFLEGMRFRIMVIRFGAHVFQFPFTFIAIISAFEILMM